MTVTNLDRYTAETLPELVEQLNAHDTATAVFGDDTPTHLSEDTITTLLEALDTTYYWSYIHNEYESPTVQVIELPDTVA